MHEPSSDLTTSPRPSRPRDPAQSAVDPGPKVLVAVRDAHLCHRIATIFADEGHAVEQERQAGLQILSRLVRREPSQVALLILDIADNPWTGRALLHAVFSESTALPVILIAEESVIGAQGLQHAGVQAIWSRDVDSEQIRRAAAAFSAEPAAPAL